jgi:superfamily II DNA/RNA helicase
MNTEINNIKKGASIITGTPGRVYDHLSRKTLWTKHIHYLVLDEADRMLDMGFYDQVVKIIKELSRNRVTLLFSATMPPEIQRICKTYMKEPVTIELDSDTKTVDTIKQVYYRVMPNEKRTQLERLLRVEQPDSSIIFCNTRSEVDVVERYLKGKGYEVGALHGGNTQNSRMKIIQRFKDKKLQIIVATDVAARGIHIDDLSMVINYDVPVEKDSYIHRIGRTGRIGNMGKAISLVTVDDIWNFYEIEEHVGVLIEEVALPTEADAAECEKNSQNKWKKCKEDNLKRLAERGSHETRKPKSSNNNRSKSSKPYQKNIDKSKTDSFKPKDSQQSKSQKATTFNKEMQKSQKPQSPMEVKTQKPTETKAQKPMEAKTQKPTEVKSQKPMETKPQQREIDYRAEAKKLLARANIEQKPTLKQRIGKLFKKEK